MIGEVLPFIHCLPILSGTVGTTTEMCFFLRSLQTTHVPNTNSAIPTGRPTKTSLGTLRGAFPVILQGE